MLQSRCPRSPGDHRRGIVSVLPLPPDTSPCQLPSRNGRSPSVRSPKASSSSPSARAASARTASTSSSKHDRFFLYPTFDHQRNDLVRDSHQPELRRALEEGVWPDGDPPPHALTRDGGIPQPDRVRIRAWAEVAAHFTITDPRVGQRAVPVLRLDDGLRARSAWRGSAATRCTSLLLRTYRIPRPVTVKVRDEFGGCRSWLEITRDLPFEGTPGALRRRVRARRREDRRRSARRRRPRAGLAAAAHHVSATRHRPARGTPRRVLCLGIGGGGDVVGALAVARRCARRRGTPCRGRRPDLGAPRRRPAPRPAPPRRAARRRAPARRRRARRPATTRPRRLPLRRGRAWPSCSASRPCSSTRTPGPAGVAAGHRRGGRAPRLRPRRPARRGRRRPRPRRRARAGAARSPTRSLLAAAPPPAPRPACRCSAPSSAPAATASSRRTRSLARLAEVGAARRRPRRSGPAARPGARLASRRRRRRPHRGQRDGAALRARRARGPAAIRGGRRTVRAHRVRAAWSTSSIRAAADGLARARLAAAVAGLPSLEAAEDAARRPRRSAPSSPTSATPPRRGG